MAQRLQKAPQGLLQIFRLRSGGVGPNEFSDTLTPTVDTFDMYAVDRWAAATQASAAGTFPRTVTAGASAFARRLVYFSGTVTFGAAAVGTYVSMELTVRGLTGVVTVVVAEKTFVPVTAMAGASIHVAMVSAPIILPPAHIMRFNVASDVAGADHVATMNWAWQRLDSD